MQALLCSHAGVVFAFRQGLVAEVAAEKFITLP